jgi:hypothetical protein
MLKILGKIEKIIKWLIKLIFIVILITLTLAIFVNTCRNSPAKIKNRLSSKIKNYTGSDYHSWLWQKNRELNFDIIVLNIFTYGNLSLSIAGESDFRNEPSYLLNAEVVANNFFKEIFDAKMNISSAISKDKQFSLWYSELSVMPEKNRSKEIIFDIKNNIATRDGLMIKIPNNTFDPLSVIFKLLDYDFQINRQIEIKLLSKREIYVLKATPVELRDSIYKLEGEVLRQDRSSNHRVGFTLWVLNGSVRAPLLIKAVTAAGPVYLRLKSVK